jgi:hypothetical protein
VGEAGPSEGEYKQPTYSPPEPWARLTPVIDAAASVLSALAAKLSTPNQ